MDSPGVRKKMSDDASKGSYSSTAVGGGGSGGAYNPMSGSGNSQIEKDNSRFMGNQQQVTQKAIERQDEQLEVLDEAVTRLHVIGENVHTGLQFSFKSFESNSTN
jgi:hypothetical protein